MSVNRKTVRGSIVASLKLLQSGTVYPLADEGGTPHVYSYLATGFRGMTPMCTVESYRSKLDTDGDDANQPFRFIVGFWVKRDEGAGSAAEDTLDDLEYGLRAILRKSYNGRYSQDSEPGYDIIDGEEYRVEFHFIDIDW